MTTHYYFVEPLDVLMIRGNKSFGGAGEHGEAVMPPWPSLFAGAFRSALLADDAGRLADFVAIGTDRNLSVEERRSRMQRLLGDSLFRVLGTPLEPGDFRISWLSLARRYDADVSALVPLPADLAVLDAAQADTPVALRPAPLPGGVAASLPLPMAAVLRTQRQGKPAGGHWLDINALAAHLAGMVPQTTLTTAELYKRETRLGIALDGERRTAAEGALYTTEAVAFRQDTGFLVGVEGDHGQLPQSGLLRLGGDGRGARYERVGLELPEAALPPHGERFRLILATPGLFAGGWLPPGIRRGSDGGYRLVCEGFSARLACATVSRNEVVSGWDLANWRPKIAQRVVPAGTVYWFDEFDGDAGKLAEWVKGGLWGEDADQQRRAEGFNNAWLGTWATA